LNFEQFKVLIFFVVEQFSYMNFFMFENFQICAF
jgi:hypothetical protein